MSKYGPPLKMSEAHKQFVRDHLPRTIALTLRVLAGRGEGK